MLKWLKSYIASPTHKWWVDNVWRPSWTKFTTYIYGVPAAALSLGEGVSKLANDTTISGYLTQLNVPNWVPMALAGIALVHYLAAGHDK